MNPVGTVHAAMIPVRTRQRFWARVKLAGSLECWLWTGNLSHNGYGRFSFGDGTKTRKIRAHRAAWELTNGRIPQGLTVEHVCRNRLCCNPAHMELLTQAANVKGQLVVNTLTRLLADAEDEADRLRLALQRCADAPDLAAAQSAARAALNGSA